MTKQKFQVMIVIVSGIQINWASVIFKIMSEMMQKKITGFTVQINVLLQNATFSLTAASDGTSVTIIDAENVMVLQPKPLSVPEFLAIKKEIGEEHQKAQQLRRPKRKMVTVVSDSEQSHSIRPLHPFHLLQNPSQPRYDPKP